LYFENKREIPEEARPANRYSAMKPVLPSIMMTGGAMK
jgi:hypothetical protein